MFVQSFNALGSLSLYRTNALSIILESVIERCQREVTSGFFPLPNLYHEYHANVELSGEGHGRVVVKLIMF